MITKKQIEEQAKLLQNEIVENRRFLHAHAELGFHLPKTKAFVKEQLTEMGYAPREIGRGGVVALVGGEKNKGDRYAFMLRADMDGLPIKENTGLPFACKSGNMHACGHDMHTAMLLGVAKLLKTFEKELPYPVKLLFQPAEERLEGAKNMLEAGVLAEPKVLGAAMLHVMTDSPLRTGTFVIPSEGVGAPAADYFTVKVRGKSCHGSAPQNGVDALSAAARVLLALEELSARELPAGEGTVLTVGQLQGGNAPNAIAGEAVLRGTLRSFDEETRVYAKKRLTEIAVGVAKAFRARAKVTFDSGCPALVNDGELCKSALSGLTELFGESGVLSAADMNGDVRKRSGGSEDFAYIAQKTPSLMIALAAGEREKGYAYPLHHEKTSFDESCLWRGAAALAYLAARENRV